MRIISHKGKDLIKAVLANKLYKAEIKFKVGRGKPQTLIKGDAGVRCQDFFCQTSSPVAYSEREPRQALVAQERAGSPSSFVCCRQLDHFCEPAFASSQNVRPHRFQVSSESFRASGDWCGPNL